MKAIILTLGLLLISTTLFIGYRATAATPGPKLAPPDPCSSHIFTEECVKARAK